MQHQQNEVEKDTEQWDHHTHFEDDGCAVVGRGIAWEFCQIWHVKDFAEPEMQDENAGIHSMVKLGE